MALIGPAGRLFEIKDPARLEVVPADQTIRGDSLGYRRSLVEPGPSTPYRNWNLSIQLARPREIAALRALSLREWGTRPMYWVPPAAPETNLLTPSASLCTIFTHAQPSGTVQGGEMALDFGWAGQSWVTGPGRQVIFGRAPYYPGKPVTVRFWARPDGASAVVRVRAFAASGRQLAEYSSPARPVPSAGGWVHWSWPTMPADTAYVTAMAASVLQATRPSVTWTTSPREWSDGAGCMSAWVQPMPSVYLRATGDYGTETVTSHDFEILEFAS